VGKRRQYVTAGSAVALRPNPGFDGRDADVEPLLRFLVGLRELSANGRQVRRKGSDIVPQMFVKDEHLILKFLHAAAQLIPKFLHLAAQLIPKVLHLAAQLLHLAAHVIQSCSHFLDPAIEHGHLLFQPIEPLFGHSCLPR
jgi:hypothetical protein